MRTSLLHPPSAGISLYHNSTPVSTAVWGITESSPSREARLGAWTTSRAASGSPELRGCLRRNGPDHQIFVRMSRLARSSAGTSFYHNSTPFSKLFGEQTRAPLAGRRVWGPDRLSRGVRELWVPRRFKRNGPDHLSRGISEHRFARMSQAKRPIPDNAETRVARMSQAKRPGPPDVCEDVSTCPLVGRN